jgi:hypothetical protein
MGRTDDELKAHLHALEARDQSQRVAIAAFGVDLSKRRAVDLTFWADDEAKATALAEALRRNELSSVVRSPVALDGRWIVGASLEASVDWMTTRENIATFVLFADKYDCVYDGWGTAIVEALPGFKPNG